MTWPRSSYYCEQKKVVIWLTRPMCYGVTSIGEVNIYSMCLDFDRLLSAVVQSLGWLRQSFVQQCACGACVCAFELCMTLTLVNNMLRGWSVRRPPPSVCSILDVVASLTSRSVYTMQTLQVSEASRYFTDKRNERCWCSQQLAAKLLTASTCMHVSMAMRVACMSPSRPPHISSWRISSTTSILLISVLFILTVKPHLHLLDVSVNDSDNRIALNKASITDSQLYAIWASDIHGF